MRGPISVARGLWPYCRSESRKWLLSFAASALAVCAGLVAPRILGAAVEALRAGTATRGLLLTYGGFILFTTAVTGAFLLAMRRLGPGAARRSAYALRADLFNRITRMETAFFQRTRTGVLLSALTSDVAAVQEMLGFGVVGLFNLALTVLLTAGSMVALSPLLGTVVLVAAPAIAGLLTVMIRRAETRYGQTQDQLSQVSVAVQEAVAGIRIVKSFAAEEHQAAAFAGQVAEHRRRALRLARVEAPLRATAGLALNVLFVGVMLLGATRFLAQESDGTFAGLSVGGFVAFVTYLYQLTLPLLFLGAVLDALQRGAVSWRRLAVYLSAEPGFRDGAARIAVPPAGASLRFDGVSLVLQGRPVLQDVTFDVAAGRVVGVTGRTGSGKSMLAALAVRLFDPTSGRVLLDGRDIRDLPLSAVRGAVGLVPQEPFLFSATIAENIAFGLPGMVQVRGDQEVDRDRVRWAGAAAGLEEEIQQFHRGYDTPVGERGVTLSGGQRQRVSLARALAREGPVLILDDAFAAVDAETEARLLVQLREWLLGRGVLLISHRATTLRVVDDLVVLGRGRVVEQGPPGELLARGGYYASLVRRQRLEETVASAEAGPAKAEVARR